MLAPSDVVGEQARSRYVAESRTVAPFGTQAERKSSPIPRRRYRTCSGTEEGAFLAGVWTIVAVAGQTQEHPVTLDGLACRDRAIDRATTVPQISHSGRFAELVPRFQPRRFMAARPHRLALFLSEPRAPVATASIQAGRPR